jgi:hypothetical protein
VAGLPPLSVRVPGFAAAGALLHEHADGGAFTPRGEGSLAGTRAFWELTTPPAPGEKRRRAVAAEEAEGAPPPPPPPPRTLAEDAARFNASEAGVDAPVAWSTLDDALRSLALGVALCHAELLGALARAREGAAAADAAADAAAEAEVAGGEGEGAPPLPPPAPAQQVHFSPWVSAGATAGFNGVSGGGAAPFSGAPADGPLLWYHRATLHGAAPSAEAEAAAGVARASYEAGLFALAQLHLAAVGVGGDGDGAPLRPLFEDDDAAWHVVAMLAQRGLEAAQVLVGGRILRGRGVGWLWQPRAREEVEAEALFFAQLKAGLEDSAGGDVVRHALRSAKAAAAAGEDGGDPYDAVNWMLDAEAEAAAEAEAEAAAAGGGAPTRALRPEELNTHKRRAWDRFEAGACHAALPYLLPAAVAASRDDESTSRAIDSSWPFWMQHENNDIAGATSNEELNVAYLVEQEAAGDLGAALQLGNLYMHGAPAAGVRMDPFEAMRLLQRAAGVRVMVEPPADGAAPAPPPPPQPPQPPQPPPPLPGDGGAMLGDAAGAAGAAGAAAAVGAAAEAAVDPAGGVAAAGAGGAAGGPGGGVGVGGAGVGGAGGAAFAGAARGAPPTPTPSPTPTPTPAPRLLPSDPIRAHAAVLASILSLQNFDAPHTAAGVSLVRNDSAVLTLLREGAAQGSVEAFAALGFVYQAGALGVVNMSEAVHWLERAAAAGNVVSRCNLAALLLQAPPAAGPAAAGADADAAAAAAWGGVTRNATRAREHLETAISQSGGTFFIPAEYNLAMVHLFPGDGGGEDGDGEEELQDMEAWEEEAAGAAGRGEARGAFPWFAEGATAYAAALGGRWDFWTSPRTAECAAGARRLARVGLYGGKWTQEVHFSLAAASAAWAPVAALMGGVGGGGGGSGGGGAPPPHAVAAAERAALQSLLLAQLGVEGASDNAAFLLERGVLRGRLLPGGLAARALEMRLLLLRSAAAEGAAAALATDAVGLPRGATGGAAEASAGAVFEWEAPHDRDAADAEAGAALAEAEAAAVAAGEDGAAQQELPPPGAATARVARVEALVHALRSRAAAALEGPPGAAEGVAAGARAADAAGGPPLLRFWPPPERPAAEPAAEPLADDAPTPSRPRPRPPLSHALAPFVWYLEAAAGQALPSYEDPSDASRGPRGLSGVGLLGGGDGGHAEWRLASCWAERWEGVPFCAWDANGGGGGGGGGGALAWLATASRGSHFAAATHDWARALSRGASANFSAAWRLLDAALAQEALADAPVALGKAALLWGWLRGALWGGGSSAAAEGRALAAAVVTQCMFQPAPPLGDWGAALSGVLNPKHGPLFGGFFQAPGGGGGGARGAAAAPAEGGAPHPTNASSGARQPPRNATMHPAVSVDWDEDVNDDGLVDERDWDILEGEAARLLDVRLDAALGERHWVGPLPLSAADRRLCGAVMGAARAVSLAVAALLAILLLCRCRPRC